MAFAPVPAWDMAALAASEATWGTIPNPAASQALQLVSFDAGQSEQGEVRAIKDRGLGRAMAPAYVEGRVKPIPFSLETSVKARTANTTVPQESVIMKAAGLLETVGGSSVAYTPPASPVLSGAFASLSLYRFFGQSPYTLKAEQLRGGLIKTLEWSGGDKELMLKAAGEAIGRNALAYAPSITLADAGGTSLVFTDAEEGYRFGVGWYQVESEVIKITSMNYSTFTATIARAQLSTTGAAHAAKALRPYVPSMSYPAAAIPMSEQNVAVTVDSVAMRAMAADVQLTTGMEMGPPESGSKYTQAPKVLKYDLKASLKMMLHQEDTALEGKATQRKLCALTFAFGTGTGGIVTFSIPYAEIVPFKTPDTNNDVALVDVSFRTRDNSGNDAFSITYT